MTEPNELMLGNYIFVEFQVSEVIEIEGLIVRVRNDEFPNVGSCFGRSECDPIPLSDAVLEACGFIKHGHEWHNEQSEYSFLISKFSDGYALCEPCKKGIGNKYLHQLQNIYFIVTGQPIEIGLIKLKNALK